MDKKHLSKSSDRLESYSLDGSKGADVPLELLLVFFETHRHDPQKRVDWCCQSEEPQEDNDEVFLVREGPCIIDVFDLINQV